MTTENNQATNTENNSNPQPGTPEYDLQMRNVAREAAGQEPLTGDQQTADDAKLPEGVSMDDLLAAWNAQQQSQNSESDDEEGGDQNLSGNTDDQSTDDGQSDPNNDLQNRVRDLENQIITEKVYTAAGGEEQFKALKERASTELSETENSMLSEVLEKGSAAEAVAAVQMLKRLLSADVETHGRFVGGQPAPANTAFADRSELHAAQADPRYRMRGPQGDAFRREVEQKLSRSRFLR